MTTKRIYFCCNGSAGRRLVCAADGLLHAVRLHWHWLCDVHDRNIWSVFD